jgi:glyoxylase-like metal-dependent hydrolase (beta-lactamase superfamily II)
VGTKFNDKLMKIYQIDFSKHTMEKSFNEHGFSFDDVTDVIFTHLHFDHCGGTSFLDEQGNSHFTFPNAEYHVTKTHWETATNPNAREKASFLPQNINPLKETNKLHLVDEGHKYEEGLSTIVVNGHTLGQQLPLIEGDGKKLCFMADLLPTHVHVPLAWVMGYDMYPAETLKEKEEFLTRSVEEDFNLYLQHDYYKEIIKLGSENGKISVTESLTLNEL